ncbi:MAG: MBL fold metallo-hydrolase [Prevotella sp.]
MKLRFLGTGTSNGVPVLGCNCAVCQSNDSRDKRYRTSALIETANTRIMLDCGPDARMQLLQVPFKAIDAVLISHIHYDHVSGIDDLRPFCQFGDIDVYANSSTVKALKQTMPYCFTDELYPGVPRLNLHTIESGKAFQVNEVEVLPIKVYHGKLPILAYRFGDVAYITDMKTIDDEEKELLKGVKVFVVNGLRWKKEHHSHQLIDEAIAFSRSIGAEKTFLTHVTHEIGLHVEASKCLPNNVYFAYDGLEIEV